MCGCEGHRDREPEGSWLVLGAVVAVAAAAGAGIFYVWQWLT